MKDAGVPVAGRIRVTGGGWAGAGAALCLLLAWPAPAGQLGGAADHPRAMLDAEVCDVRLSSSVVENRILLLWHPPNDELSGGVKITRATSSDFAPSTVDVFTKWLPGVGYRQVVLPTTAASDQAFYYRVAFIEPGDPPRVKGLSNPVRVEPLRTNKTFRARKPRRMAPEHGVWSFP